ncbi:MAG: septum formation inhibitor Maf [Gammaproteobacteria bacterium]|nr:septum formation inhibitor Maf [Gammaproteobacteria bacterium]
MHDTNDLRQELVLASSSPYRSMLLKRLGIEFSIVSPQVDESREEDEPAHLMAARLSEDKAMAVADTYPQTLIIGSDQVAVLDGEIIGKPGTHEKAVEQLRKASGRSMHFYSGLCLLNTMTGERQTDVIDTEVRLRPISDELIEAYLRKEQPYDCAGACKVEGLGIALIDYVYSGDPTALIGLPLIRLCEMLRAEGIEPLQPGFLGQ